MRTQGNDGNQCHLKAFKFSQVLKCFIIIVFAENKGEAMDCYLVVINQEVNL
jgi:hypothetical protein